MRNIKDKKDHPLNETEKNASLNIARKTLEECFAGRDYLPETGGHRVFGERHGAFVTLRKRGELRGCIGLFESDKPLSEVIKEMTLAAAFQDNRFEPLIKDEMSEVKIEISVLSPMKKIGNIDGIELGKHGVNIRRGRNSGVFLPQVARETGWDKNTFLNSLCVEKAGLEPGCWRDPQTEIFIFTAQVFEE